ncbi:MAG TPA: ABC transporter transmembrane domain-containing protein, partial [Alphaproteobacteria bacterium]
AEKIVSDLSARSFGHLLKLDPAFFDRHNSHEMAARISADAALIQGVVATSMPLVLRNILMLIGGIAMLATTSPRLTLLVLIVLPLVAVPVIVLGRMVRRNARHVQDETGNLGGLLGESLSGIQTVQSFTYENALKSRYNEATRNVSRAALRQTLSRSGMVSSVILILFSSICVVLWYGAHDVLDGNLSAGNLVSFVFYAGMVASAFGVLGDMGSALIRAAAAFERMTAILNVQPNLADSNFTPDLKGDIAFNAASFAYQEQNILNGLTLSIPAGTTAALVGASGEGKTTVFKLLMRLYDVQSGAVTVDGHDVRAINLNTLRQAISYVPQDAILFSGSVRENILVGNPDASDAEMFAAAKASLSHDFIQSLPDGYNTLVGERGMKLSGGQRQRIALARALLKNAPVLLLDEATASLDTENEQAIQQALKGQHGKRTMLIIAHRLSTVMEADMIFVMSGGQIVEQGTHADLVAKRGLYSRMVEAQFLTDESRARRLHPDIPAGIVH